MHSSFLNSHFTEAYHHVASNPCMSFWSNSTLISWRYSVWLLRNPVLSHFFLFFHGWHFYPFSSRVLSSFLYSQYSEIFQWCALVGSFSFNDQWILLIQRLVFQFWEILFLFYKDILPSVFSFILSLLLINQMLDLTDWPTYLFPPDFSASLFLSLFVGHFPSSVFQVVFLRLCF